MSLESDLKEPVKEWVVRSSGDQRRTVFLLERTWGSHVGRENKTVSELKHFFRFWKAGFLLLCSLLLRRVGGGFVLYYFLRGAQQQKKCHLSLLGGDKNLLTF